MYRWRDDEGEEASWKNKARRRSRDTCSCEEHRGVTSACQCQTEKRQLTTSPHSSAGSDPTVCALAGQRAQQRRRDGEDLVGDLNKLQEYITDSSHQYPSIAQAPLPPDSFTHAQNFLARFSTSAGAGPSSGRLPEILTKSSMA